MNGNLATNRLAIIWDIVKAGLWTVDWTLDWTMDWTVDCTEKIQRVASY